MINTLELRPKVKKFMNALDPMRPIVFGNSKLVENGAEQSLYVTGLHGGNRDLVRELADQIDFDEGGGTYLFSGNRGTGKTTELMRLADELSNLNCVVFYLNMLEFFNPTTSVEITDFLICVLGGFSEKIEKRFGGNPGKRGFFERIAQFLQSEVKISGIDLSLGGDIKTTIKMSLQQDPEFKRRLQKGTRGYVAQVVQQARQFVTDAVTEIRAHMPDFARLTEGKYILNYRNGKGWFDVHPLLRDTVSTSD